MAPNRRARGDASPHKKKSGISEYCFHKNESFWTCGVIALEHTPEEIAGPSLFACCDALAKAQQDMGVREPVVDTVTPRFAWRVV